jgi:hypothetical protein
MTPVVRNIPVAFPVTVMLMPGKKNNILVSFQGKLFFILGNIQSPLHADDNHKGIKIPALMHKIFLVQKLAGRNVNQGINIFAD